MKFLETDLEAASEASDSDVNEQTKMIWQVPELFYLDAEKTFTGSTNFTESDTGGWVIS